MSHSRRHVLAGLSAAGAACVLGSRSALADEAPPEVTTVRLRFEEAPPIMVNGVAENALCVAPMYVADELLRTEGFTEIRYVRVKSGPPFTEALRRGEIDLAMIFVPGAVRRLDGGVPLTVLAGVHPGCFELFVHEHIRTFTDLKGKQVGFNEGPGSAEHLYLSIMAAYVGLDPAYDINWVMADDVASPMQLFAQGKIDAYLAFVPEFPELRARKIGHVIVNMAMDRPWSQYFCCILAGNTDFVRQYPLRPNGPCAPS
jgi:NitT/TauT family transport system substrate-binding protein